MKMKSIVALSLAFNVVLAGVGGTVWRQNLARSVSAAAPEPESLAVKAKEPAAVESRPAPEPFRWSQLESSDDATYARNLRAVGCPEATIRDLVTAAIARRFDQKRQGLAAARQQGRVDAAGYRDAVAQSWEEQNKSVEGLSGTAAVSGMAGGSPATGAASPAGKSAATNIAPASGPAGGDVPPAIVSRNPNIRMPLALSEPDPALGLNDAQKAAAASIADNFAKAVNSQPVDPKSPAYHKLWQSAQQEADAELKVQIGWPAFVTWQTRNFGQ